MIKNYFKITFINFWKNKTQSFLNIFGLGLGIACAGLIFLWVEDELNYDHSNLKHDKLFQVMENQAYEGKVYTFPATPGPLAQGMKDELPEVKNACRTTWQQSVLFSFGNKTIYEDGLYADSSIFSLFTLPFVMGEASNAFQQKHSLVISEKMAKKFFGEEKNIVGKRIKVDNKEEYVITAVMKDLPDNSTLKFEWLSPFTIYSDQNSWLQHWGSNGIRTFVELNSTNDFSAINKKLSNYIQSKEKGLIAKPFLLGMNDWRLRNNFQDGKQTGGAIEYIRLFSIIAWIIILIAGINFMNLSTARSEKRAREVGVRKVLGAVRGNLIAQFMGEAAFLSFLSVLLALLFIYFILPAFNSLVEKNLTIALGNPLHISVLLSFSLFCGVLAGSYPSFYLSSFNPVYVLKGEKIKSGSVAFIRRALVVVQFTVSITLIISTLIIYRQIQHIKQRDLGYNKEKLIQLDLKGNMKKDYTFLRQSLLSTGYVENLALSMLNILYMGSSTSDITWAGKDPKKAILITQNWISPEYIKTAGIKIIQGRDFHPDPKQDSSSIILNETFAKMIDNKNSLGKILSFHSKNYTVVGVIKDIVYSDMYGKSDPIVFICYPDNYNFMYLRLKPAVNIESALEKIRTIVSNENPGFPFGFHFLDDNFQEIFKTEVLVGKLSSIFAILAIIISCLGLFGLAAYTGESRTKEIGIRKVLGASVSGITGLISWDFLKLVLISSIIAFPLAWWVMYKWLQEYAYRIEITWGVFLIAGATALLIAMLTISFQAIKAALSNPIKSLRTE
jgi:putative ABC transport system permease protein